MNNKDEDKNIFYHKWQTSSKQWNKIKYIVREMRKELTVAEKLLWQQLRAHKLDNLKFRRQHSIDRFVVDFYCKKINLIIEVDGEIHDYQKESDLMRQQFLEELGYKVLRLKNEEIINNMEEVLKLIKGCENDCNPSPALPAGGEGEERKKIID